MPAIQRYKIHSQKAIIHEVTELNGVECWRSQNSIADSATTAPPILDLIAGGCWPRRQLHNVIRYFPPAIFIHEVTGSQVGVESRVRVESRVGEGLLMSIMIGPVY